MCNDSEVIGLTLTVSWNSNNTTILIARISTVYANDIKNIVGGLFIYLCLCAKQCSIILVKG